MPSSDMILRDGIEMSSMNTPEMKDIVEGIIRRTLVQFYRRRERHREKPACNESELINFNGTSESSLDIISRSEDGCCI